MCPWYETFRKVVVFDGLKYPLLSHAGTEMYACTHGVHGGGIVPPSLAPLVHGDGWLSCWSVDHSRWVPLTHHSHIELVPTQLCCVGPCCSVVLYAEQCRAFPHPLRTNSSTFLSVPVQLWRLQGDGLTLLWCYKGDSITVACQEGELLPSQLWNISDHRRINIRWKERYCYLVNLEL